ncbi:hypothetical protein [Niabella drilacis]|uniref:PH domain-containing protein n=1 Tax=Niabella drilacis (strain DSM 25811 / CCM 8410 / CCUG 62505 / LMG 26954 / E90) TaxID=1285928 RepID=A0A1G6LR36_NIADE|nr:hypothetical protein [Niabella drilacis]SDC45651.1 hypothetical protein SAMN04487894_102431 [Niabella drilacis]
MPDFYFGTAQHLIKYQKQDILKIAFSGQSNSRSPVRDFAVYTIFLNNGTRLSFTSILITPDQLRNKMTGVRIEEMHRFAWPAFKAL